jgi:hypothetical protein
VHIRGELGADGTSLSDEVGGPLHDLVVHSTGLCMPGSTAPGDAIAPPKSSDVMGPAVAGLPLRGSSGSPPPTIDWRQVEDNTEFACSQVTVVERLL